MKRMTKDHCSFILILRREKNHLGNILTELQPQYVKKDDSLLGASRDNESSSIHDSMSMTQKPNIYDVSSTIVLT